MKEAKRVVEVKRNGKYVREEYVEQSGEEVYRHLANDLIAKKLNECRWIRSIRRRNNYDGTQTIVVSYDNDVRAIYTIECR